MNIGNNEFKYRHCCWVEPIDCFRNGMKNRRIVNFPQLSKGCWFVENWIRKVQFPFLANRHHDVLRSRLYSN